MKYLTKNEGPNRQQRNAAMFGNKTSGTDNRKGGWKMRQRIQSAPPEGSTALSYLDKVMNYRNNVCALMARAGIKINL